VRSTAYASTCIHLTNVFAVVLSIAVWVAGRCWRAIGLAGHAGPAGGLLADWTGLDWTGLAGEGRAREGRGRASAFVSADTCEFSGHALYG
jgi:hypothetical protein